MARIGFKSAKYNLHDTSSKKYKGTTATSLEKVIDEKFAPEYNNAELYASDGLAESDYSFKKGTLTITVANDDDTKDAELLGNTTATNEVTKSIDDTAPDVGYGHIVTKMVNGAKKYKVEFFPRVKFSKITTDAKTRGEGVEFGTTTIEGVVYPLTEAFNGLTAGVWEKHQTFDTEAAATAYLDSCLTPAKSGS